MDTEKRRKFGKIKDNLVCHLVDSTALLAESTPVFASLEVGFAGMSYDISMKARMLNGLLLLSGTSTLYTKGREVYRKLFNITDKTRERIQGINDAIYTGLFTLVLSPTIYLISGARDPLQIGIGVAGAVGLGLVNGFPAGYSVDMFRDLTGLKNCERPSYPDLIKKQNPKIKKGLATLLVAGSIAITSGLYHLIPNKPETLPSTSTINEIETQKFT